MLLSASDVLQGWEAEMEVVWLRVDDAGAAVVVTAPQRVRTALLPSAAVSTAGQGRADGSGDGGMLWDGGGRWWTYAPGRTDVGHSLRAECICTVRRRLAPPAAGGPETRKLDATTKADSATIGADASAVPAAGWVSLRRGRAFAHTRRVVLADPPPGDGRIDDRAAANNGERGPAPLSAPEVSTLLQAVQYASELFRAPIGGQIRRCKASIWPWYLAVHRLYLSPLPRLSVSFVSALIFGIRIPADHSLFSCFILPTMPWPKAMLKN